MVEKLTPNQVRQIELIQGFIRNVDHVKKLVGDLEGNRAARPVIINNICGAIARYMLIHTVPALIFDASRWARSDDSSGSRFSCPATR